MLQSQKSLKFFNFRVFEKNVEKKFLEHVEKSEIKKSQISNNFGE